MKRIPFLFLCLRIWYCITEYKITWVHRKKIMIFKSKVKMRFWDFVFNCIQIFKNAFLIFLSEIHYLQFFFFSWQVKYKVTSCKNPCGRNNPEPRSGDVVLNALKALRFELDVLCPKKPFYKESHHMGSCRAAVELFPIWQKRLMPKQMWWSPADKHGRQLSQMLL